MQKPAYVYLRKGRWYWEPPPRLRGPRFRTVALGADQAAAWDLAHRLNHDLAGGDAVLPGSVRWLFQRFEESEAFRDLAASTQKDYRWLARMLSGHPVGAVPLGTLPAAAIKARHADRIYPELRAKHGDSAAHYACRFARRVWKWGRRQEHVGENPWAEMGLATPKARIQRWTWEQVEAFCTKAREMGWPSMALAVRLGYWTSLRQGDVLRLTWTALAAGVVRTSKTGAEVPVVTSAYPDLEAALAAAPRTAVQVLVCETTGRPWLPDHFRHVFREVAAAAGLPPDLQFRDLRATALTELSDGGADPILASTHSGHLTPQMQRRYARRTPEQFAEAAQRRLARRNARRNVGT